MHNPERRNYVKGTRPNGACYFCEDITNQFHIKEYTQWWLIANKYPFIDFALLAIPKRHVEFVTDLYINEWHELQIVLEEPLKAWKNYYLTEYPRTENEKILDGDFPSWNIVSSQWPEPTYKIDNEMTVYINNGEHSGRTVPHLHWNIVPRIYIRRTGLEVSSQFQKVKYTPEETAELFKKIMKVG